MVNISVYSLTELTEHSSLLLLLFFVDLLGFELCLYAFLLFRPFLGALKDHSTALTKQGKPLKVLAAIFYVQSIQSSFLILFNLRH